MKFNALRDGFVAICFLLLATLIALKLQSDAELAFEGSFRVADGDSLAVGEKRLRLLGIDAPELGQTCRRDGTAWPCGRAARQALAGLIALGGVSCRGDRTDRYGRLLVTCRTADRNLNQDMVTAGMAFAFGDYDAEEAEARKARIGLWAGEVMRPSDWRRTHRAGMAGETPHLPHWFSRLFGSQ